MFRFFKYWFLRSVWRKQPRTQKHVRLFLLISATLLLVIPLYWGAWVIAYGRPVGAGSAGDMFGALTSFFTGLAFVGLIITMLMQNEDLRLQRKELAATREELKGQREQLEVQNSFIAQQNFESAFFNIIKNWNNLINGLSTDYNGVKSSGRETFERLFRNFHIDIDKKGANVNSGEIIKSYHLFYSKNENTIGSYYRLLYSIMSLTENSSVEDKRLYFNLIRAQLSSSELWLLILFGLSIHGRDSVKPYIEKYDLLKHLPIQRHIIYRSLVGEYDLTQPGIAALAKRATAAASPS